MDKSPELLHTTEQGEVKLFFDRVAEYQDLLESLPPDQVTDELKQNIVAELDTICPFAQYQVLICGRGVLPDFNEEEQWVGDVYATIKDDFIQGIHIGTAIILSLKAART